MQPWQLVFLGRHELPRELTSFELSYFFSFNDAERRTIHYGNIVAARGRRREELAAISGSLVLLSNFTMAWMTYHMQAVLDRWKRDHERTVDRETLRHIGPAHFEGVNVRGKFDFPLRQYQERLLSKTVKQE